MDGGIPSVSHGFVLVAEDDREVRESLTLLLEDSGYHVIAVEDGQAALDELERATPCLLLLDLMMPRVSGWSVLATMRSDARLQAVPVCVVSAVAERAPKDVSCVLPKPVNVQKLLETIASYCGRKLDR